MGRSAVPADLVGQMQRMQEQVRQLRMKRSGSQRIQHDFDDLPVPNPLTFLSGGLLAANISAADGDPGTQVRVISKPLAPNEPVTGYPYGPGLGQAGYYHAGTTIVFFPGSPTIWTLGTDAANFLPIGTFIYFINLRNDTTSSISSGAATMVKPGSITETASSSAFFSKIAGTMRAYKYDANKWMMSGDVAP